ncbi:predicted protein [Pyrenophora tritici-repentis Pt-1C-BFP]|uniref:Uncharacterized protein n=1 Tax=Pyrenophora tritici-repentis (strain Pt-1C-BFP) TaxID=426418 RepID=B2W5T5_PYRTR|nr:uncharacterized protein PTRG_06093 [Pyrenophora tritici-repentis Pt-1C-BFP]EDU49013.1 predicted protein [Pyrenophora tritici-repentis Pt-1C-BFP]
MALYMRAPPGSGVLDAISSSPDASDVHSRRSLGPTPVTSGAYRPARLRMAAPTS